MEEEFLTFEEALTKLKEGYVVSRHGWNNKKLGVSLQRPTELSKMTEPYLYMTKEVQTAVMKVEGKPPVTKRFPLDLSCESLLAEDWFVLQGAAITPVKPC